MEYWSIGVLDSRCQHFFTPTGEISRRVQKEEIAPMLTKEENESLTRVGPGTPAGEMLRRYWHPIAFV